jgi:DNA-binding XRE family transcriptional regulator
MHVSGMANEILHIRKALGLTQPELADRLGVDQSTVWRWENEVVTPSKATMIALRSMLPSQRVTPAAMDAARYEEAIDMPECAP